MPVAACSVKKTLLYAEMAGQELYHKKVIPVFRGLAGKQCMTLVAQADALAVCLLLWFTEDLPGTESTLRTLSFGA